MAGKSCRAQAGNAAAEAKRRSAAAASFHTTTSHAAGHAAARASGSATPLTGTRASHGRYLGLARGARRTLANAPIARADVDGRTGSAAPVNASISNNVAADGDVTVAISISISIIVVMVVTVQIDRAVALGGRVVAVGTRRVGITVDARLAIAVAVIPIADASGASGEAQNAQ
jgi:hypothetical protein